jgi:hypothetical protein
MRNFSIFVIEKDSIQEVRRTFKGRKLNLPCGSFWGAVTLESSDVFKKADIPLKQIQVSTETTVLDLIKQFKGNPVSFNPFPVEKNTEYIIEYSYVLKRPQISEEVVDDAKEINRKALRKYYRTRIVDLGFLNDEVVVLDKVEISRKHTGVVVLHCMHFPPTIVDFLSMVREHPSDDEPTLHMALLYTDADKEFSCFLRETYSDIHVLSGSRFKVYAIERVNTYENFQESLQYWKSLLSEKLYIVWSSLGWLSSKPYDKTQSYEIGRHLGITPEQFPCLALFDVPCPDRVLIFPLSKPYINFFRSLFKDLNLILEEFNLELEILRERSSFPFKPLKKENHGKEIYDFVKKEYMKIREKLLKNSVIESNSEVAKHVFNGKTFFVNLYSGETSMTENREIHTGGGNYYESISTSGGDYIQGNYINMSQDLTEAAAQIQDLVEQLQKRGTTVDVAQERVAQDIATQAQNNPTMKDKLLKWGQSLGDATVSDVVKGAVKLAIRSAGIPLP